MHFNFGPIIAVVFHAHTSFAPTIDLSLALPSGLKTGLTFNWICCLESNMGLMLPNLTTCGEPHKKMRNRLVYELSFNMYDTNRIA